MYVERTRGVLGLSRASVPNNNRNHPRCTSCAAVLRAQGEASCRDFRAICNLPHIRPIDCGGTF